MRLPRSRWRGLPSSRSRQLPPSCPRKLLLPKLPLPLLPVLALLLLMLPGCAFARRDNRPVWNAFEQNLVPDDRGWFVASLPLLVPAGVLSILTDTFVAHPLQVVDDAVDDAGWLWRDGRPDFEHRYYSEMAFLPVRAAATPLTLCGSLLLRSMFDVSTVEQRQDERQAQQHRLRAGFADWLQALQQGGVEPYHAAVPPLDEELQALLLATAQHSSARGRLRLFALALAQPAVAAVLDPRQGLADEDPVVRYRVLEQLPAKAEVEPALRERLRQDAVESIRQLAQARWPQPAK